jgi:zinc D-Ala-D-Ala carboxypeptidase
VSEHFTLEEFTRSALAVRRGIDNSLPPELQAQMETTLAMMERVRRYIGGARILIDSGYRCIELNRLLASKDSSDHVKAAAVDFIAPEYGPPKAIAQRIAADMLGVNAVGVGQVIYEFGRWVHVSCIAPANPVNRIITIDARGVQVGIQEIRP